MSECSLILSDRLLSCFDVGDIALHSISGLIGAAAAHSICEELRCPLDTKVFD